MPNASAPPRRIADAALARLEGETGAEADALRRFHAAERGGGSEAQRERLERLRAVHRVRPETSLAPQEVFDWRRLAVAGEDARRLDRDRRPGLR